MTEEDNLAPRPKPGNPFLVIDSVTMLKDGPGVAQFEREYQEKSQLLSFLFHDLKNKATIIDGYCQVYVEDSPDQPIGSAFKQARPYSDALTKACLSVMYVPEKSSINLQSAVIYSSPEHKQIVLGVLKDLIMQTELKKAKAMGFADNKKAIDTLLDDEMIEFEQRQAEVEQNSCLDMILKEMRYYADQVALNLQDTEIQTEPAVIASFSQVDQANHMIDKIKEVWDFDQERQIKLKDVELITLVREIIETFKGRTRDHPLRLELDLDQAEVQQIQVKADNFILGRILEACLDNAIAYSHHDSENKAGVDIKIGFSADKNEAVVSITDHGIGIKPEDLAKLRTFKLGTSLAQNHNGASTGLGLAFCNIFAQKMGARIEIDSSGEGQGFTSRLIIPLSSSL